MIGGRASGAPQADELLYRFEFPERPGALLRNLASRGASIIASLHDPTLAARFADRVLLLFGDGAWRLGPAAEILTAGSLSELYSTPIVELAASGRRVFASA